MAMSGVRSSLCRWLGAEFISAGGAKSSLDSCMSATLPYIGLYFSAQWAQNHKSITGQLVELTEREAEKITLILVSVDEDERAFADTLDRVPWVAVPFQNERRRLRLLRQYKVSNLPYLVILSGRTGRTQSRVSSDVLLKDPNCVNFPWVPLSTEVALSDLNLLKPDGNALNSASLKGHIMALYFSANWCPPCRAFTQRLLDLYKIIKSKHENFEVVFVSSDRTEDSFRSYHSSMPWPAIPWGATELRADLASVHEIKGIPSLVLLDADFSVITKEGRYFATEDPKAERFPWRLQSIEELRSMHIPIIAKNPALIYFTDDEAAERQFAKDILQPSVEKYYSENFDDSGVLLRFYVAADDDASDEVRMLANLDDFVPLLAIIDLVEGSKYVMEEGIVLSNAAVHDFLTKYTNDKIIPQPISGPPSNQINWPDQRVALCEKAKVVKQTAEGLSNSTEIALIEEIL